MSAARDRLPTAEKTVAETSEALEDDWQTPKAVGQALHVRRLKLPGCRYYDVSDLHQALADIRSRRTSLRAFMKAKP